MRRTILPFMLGVLIAALVAGAVSVYLFHDVDKDQVGHWNEAFAGLCTESVLFTAIVGIGVAILTLVARLLFRLGGYSPRAQLSFFLGVGVSALQYLWDFIGRWVFPKFEDASLYLYLLVAIVLSAVLLVGDTVREKRLFVARVNSAPRA